MAQLVGVFQSRHFVCATCGWWFVLILGKGSNANGKLQKATQNKYSKDI